MGGWVGGWGLAESPVGWHLESRITLFLQLSFLTRLFLQLSFLIGPRVQTALLFASDHTWSLAEVGSEASEGKFLRLDNPSSTIIKLTSTMY